MSEQNFSRFTVVFYVVGRSALTRSSSIAGDLHGGVHPVVGVPDQVVLLRKLPQTRRLQLLQLLLGDGGRVRLNLAAIRTLTLDNDIVCTYTVHGPVK